jgi:hypothetical protein
MKLLMNRKKHVESEKPETNWQYQSDDGDGSPVGEVVEGTETPQPRMQGKKASISWTASEFIDHQKSASWYISVLASGLVVAALLFLITRDKITGGVIVFVTVLFAYYATRKPRQISYRLADGILDVGEKQFDLALYRSYFVVSEGAFSSLTFLPLKRFALPLTVYYDPADETKITEILNDYLPMERKKQDAVDNFMRRIRF